MRKQLLYVLSALLLVAVAGILVARLVFHPFSGTLACHTWRNMLTPGEFGHFSSIALLSANDVWLAVENYAPGASVARGLVEHWDGHRWQALFPSYPASFNVTINGIAAIRDSDVWVVGSAYTSPSTVIPLAARWDGRTWHMLPSISSSGFTQFFGVTALASDNVWAVGSIFGGDFTQTLIAHWNGSTWMRVRSPNVADENNQLTSISALSANDIWVVGTSNGYQGSLLTLTEHWDGSHWSIVPSPNPSHTANALSSVAAASSNDVWAVGTLRPTPPPTTLISSEGYKSARDRVTIETNGLIEHWDGQSWQVVSFPKLGQHQILVSISAYSSQDVWAAGIFVVDTDQGQVWHGLLLHWNGAAWQSTEDSHAQYISNIATSAAGGLWSVGLTIPPPNSVGASRLLPKLVCDLQNQISLSFVTGRLTRRH